MKLRLCHVQGHRQWISSVILKIECLFVGHVSACSCESTPGKWCKQLGTLLTSFASQLQDGNATTPSAGKGDVSFITG